MRTSSDENFICGISLKRLTGSHDQGQHSVRNREKNGPNFKGHVSILCS